MPAEEILYAAKIAILIAWMLTCLSGVMVFTALIIVIYSDYTRWKIILAYGLRKIRCYVQNERRGKKDD